MVTFAEEASGLLAFDLFEREQCRRIVDEIERVDGWDDAAIRVEGSAADTIAHEIRFASVLGLGAVPDLSLLFDEKVNEIVRPVLTSFWGVDLKQHAGAQVVRYSPGGRYNAHQDAGVDCQDRYFTVVCYLNDDFEGGYTRFPHLSHATVPKAGRAVVFPSRYFHCAEPIVRGEKYVIVTWMVGPIPIRWI